MIQDNGGRGHQGGSGGGRSSGNSANAADNHRETLMDLCKKLKVKPAVFTVSLSLWAAWRLPLRAELTRHHRDVMRPFFVFCLRAAFCASFWQARKCRFSALRGVLRQVCSGCD